MNTLPLVFQNSQRHKYHDYRMNVSQYKYDKPRVKRDRDHLLRPGAVFSIKSGPYWIPVGVISRVDEHGDTFVTLTVSKPNTEPFWMKRFRSKKDLIHELGGEPISNFEQMHGLIPMVYDPSKKVQ